MTDELDTLRPEVKKALFDFDCWMSALEYDEGEFPRERFGTIRDELLRLAGENASIRAAWHDALLTGTGILKVERVDPATVMLPVAPRQGKDTSVPQSEHEALTERAEKAEAELAALKARMKPCAQVCGGEVRALMDPDDEGKYVAVLVLEE